ncbi:tryptorubin family RiPP precursor [Streptomyces sp. NPDC049954]|uniref:tryptorubin family RiPP precursor n=1 Tax=Streptomyces sp. NPDC049954 TaxID=3155779 RepID=UPI00344AF90B
MLTRLGRCGFTFGGAGGKCGCPASKRYVVLSVFRIGGTAMKLLNSLKKKIVPEKSLKSYAWYIWY